MRNKHENLNPISAKLAYFQLKLRHLLFHKMLHKVVRSEVYLILLWIFVSREQKLL